MKVVIAVAPEKYRDEELAEPVAAMNKAGIVFDIASTRPGPCTGMLGGKTSAGISFEEIDPKSYDGLIIVGGSGCQTHLWGDNMLVQLAVFPRIRKSCCCDLPCARRARPGRDPQGKEGDGL